MGACRRSPVPRAPLGRRRGPPGCFPALERAFELHEGLGEPLELARTHLVMGTTRAARSRQKRRSSQTRFRPRSTPSSDRRTALGRAARAELARIGGRALPRPADALRRPSSVSRSSSRPAGPIERSPTPSSSARRRCNGTCRRSTGSSASARARSSRRASLPPTVTSQPQPNRRLHGSPATEDPPERLFHPPSYGVSVEARSRRDREERTMYPPSPSSRPATG